MPKAWVVSIAIAVSAFACKGEKKSETADQVGNDKGAVTGNSAGLQNAPNEKTKLDLVRVDDDKGVAELTAIPKPHGVAWVDAKGGIDIAAVDAKWPQLPAGDRKRIDDAKHVYPALAYGDIDAKLQDDPPPPPEEDKPDDGEDESGGTGTAIALEEGKMGKKDSDRAEGQYKMQKTVDDPKLARQQAIEQAKKAGILGSSALGQRASAFAGTSWGEQLQGVIDARAVGDLKQPTVLVLAVPSAPAATIVDILLDYGGTIAVSNRGALKVLGFGFERPRDVKTNDSPWVEVHIGADGLHLVDAAKQTQTVIAWKNGAADRDALRDAYLKLRAERFKDKEPEVDALVVPGATTAQQLVDGLVALDSIGARPKALGLLAKGTDARLEALKTQAAPIVSIGQPNTLGDLDKAVIKKAIKENLAKFQYCYEKALLAKPGLKGTVQTQFLIGSTGNVASATGAGVDPEVASCVAGVIQKIKFPAPKGGGNVQVNYPFTFRPSGM